MTNTQRPEAVDDLAMEYFRDMSEVQAVRDWLRDEHPDAGDDLYVVAKRIKQFLIDERRIRPVEG